MFRLRRRRPYLRQLPPWNRHKMIREQILELFHIRDLLHQPWINFWSRKHPQSTLLTPTFRGV